MQVNRISNINLINTNFRASAVSKDMESQNAILMLRDPKASVKIPAESRICTKCRLCKF